MQSNIILTNSNTIKDLNGILSLQAQNHYSNLTESEANKHGFVTCKHDFELLSRMNSPYQHIIAKDQDEVVAYALVMTREYSEVIEVLKPMFRRINALKFNGLDLAQTKYVIMGQICIAKAYRSLGIFEKLYEQMAKQLKAHFQFIITEIDSENTRSLAAHKRAGFETIDIYNSSKEWQIVIMEIA